MYRQQQAKSLGGACLEDATKAEEKAKEFVLTKGGPAPCSCL